MVMRVFRLQNNIYVLIFNILVFGIYFELYPFVLEKFPNSIDSYVMFVVIIAFISVLFFMISFLVLLNRKISEWERRIKKENDLKIGKWVKKVSFGSAYDFQKELKLVNKRFPYSCKTTPKKVNYLKRHVEKKIPNEREQKAWLIYLESRSENEFAKFTLSVFASISGLTFVVESIPKLWRFVRYMSTFQKSNTEKINFNTIILFFALASLPVVFLLILLDMNREKRLRRLYINILKDITEK